ncbi:MAG: DUF523 domain-containing protein [Clostridiales bacterium]|nr:DUF523 domain-containing protein [Clostridiales bacterium]
MAEIIVSACLVGCNCRYKGDSCRCEELAALAGEHTLIPVCPEQMGGLSTPRDPAEIRGERVITCTGADVTDKFSAGAEAALTVAKLNNVKFAVLKARSPSCGKGVIYDGTFTGRKIPGDGITAKLFSENSISVFTEDELDKLKEHIAEKS